MPGGAPKPPPHIWNALIDAATHGDDYQFAIRRAEYMAWLHDQDIEGHPDPLHGHAPTDEPHDNDF